MTCARACAVAVALFALSDRSGAEYRFNLPAPQSSVAHTAYDLHIIVLWVCLAIFALVFGAMFYSLLRHRKSLGHAAHPFHESTTVEVIWTTVPFLILVGLAWPATKAVLAQKDTGNPDLTIKITGHQWKWEYEYLQEGVRFLSVLATPSEQIGDRMEKGEHYLLEVDEPLVVPVGRKVRLLLTAADVIHSWWVPALGVKQDAIPGFIRDTWFRADAPGTYRGQCAELCGRGHAFMPIVVEVKPEAEYRAWLAARKSDQAAKAAESGRAFAPAELLALGEKIFTANCAACHQANGRGIPGLFPALAGSAIVNGPPQAHVGRVLQGKPGTAMPAFAAQLDDAEIAAVVSYERQSWGNHAEPVQPALVKNQRQ
ncbi:MAG: cytochrome c oxidase subunit II [Gallionellaceae bacterium]|nr:cytochrome c oxidase subunit II [Gallionellaceae bacterium]